VPADSALNCACEAGFVGLSADKTLAVGGGEVRARQPRAFEDVVCQISRRDSIGAVAGTDRAVGRASGCR
jgi:hypothetical protein